MAFTSAADPLIRTPTFSDFEAAQDVMDYIDDERPQVQFQDRARPIPKDVWEAKRPVIEKLYIEDGLKLSQVREFMLLNHAFVAA